MMMMMRTLALGLVSAAALGPLAAPAQLQDVRLRSV
jgi:hypothetical protein